MTAFVGVGPPTAVPVQAQHRPRRRPGGNRGIDLSQLAPDEQVTEIIFLIQTGGEVTLEERALISPRWPQSFISARTVATLALRTKELQAQEKRPLITPAGVIEISSAVIPVFRLEQVQDNRPKWSHMKVPVLDGPDLGVAMILGRPFIEYTFGWDWPSSGPPGVLAQHHAGPVLLNEHYGGVMGAMG
ncbi:hypothetical protein QBC46DRAFT_450690 [Diplogelasinospora grovesii]|uniref:Uncharacterized protein n=1 Tax=Diplogelasinospora grovesii TaxID=303347 RepID=A0AAN6S3Y1_9PEZI|nr:hypothetical protein QBC46DRAFT_450690 [Diplogelasinospora grovesii]